MSNESGMPGLPFRRRATNDVDTLMRSFIRKMLLR